MKLALRCDPDEGHNLHRVAAGVLTSSDVDFVPETRPLLQLGVPNELVFFPFSESDLVSPRALFLLFFFLLYSRPSEAAAGCSGCERHITFGACHLFCPAGTLAQLCATQPLETAVLYMHVLSL